MFELIFETYSKSYHDDNRTYFLQNDAKVVIANLEVISVKKLFEWFNSYRMN